MRPLEIEPASGRVSQLPADVLGAEMFALSELFTASARQFVCAQLDGARLPSRLTLPRSRAGTWPQVKPLGRAETDTEG
jgi:hypothetical protein